MWSDHANLQRRMPIPCQSINKSPHFLPRVRVQSIHRGTLTHFIPVGLPSHRHQGNKLCNEKWFFLDQESSVHLCDTHTPTKGPTVMLPTLVHLGHGTSSESESTSFSYQCQPPKRSSLPSQIILLPFPTWCDRLTQIWKLHRKCINFMFIGRKTGCTSVGWKDHLGLWKYTFFTKDISWIFEWGES